MPNPQALDFYETVLRSATLPVLAVLLVVCWLIANCLMSERWRRARRNREIRRAEAALHRHTAARMAEGQHTGAASTHESPRARS